MSQRVDCSCCWHFNNLTIDPLLCSVCPTINCNAAWFDLLTLPLGNFNGCERMDYNKSQDQQINKQSGEWVCVKVAAVWKLLISWQVFDIFRKISMDNCRHVFFHHLRRVSDTKLLVALIFRNRFFKVGRTFASNEVQKSAFSLYEIDGVEN